MLSFVEISDNMIGVIAIVSCMLIPIIAIMSKHQLKMTALLRRDENRSQNSLSEEMRELRAMVNQQSLAINTLAESQRTLTDQLKSSDQLQERLKSNG